MVIYSLRNKNGNLDASKSNLDTSHAFANRSKISNSTLFPDVGKFSKIIKTGNVSDKLESLRKFDNETTALFKHHQKLKHQKPRYRRVKPAVSNFNFDARTDKPDIFQTFVKKNRQFEKRSQSNAKQKESVLHIINKDRDAEDLKQQMRILEQELFRC